MPLEDFHEHFKQRFAHHLGGRILVALSGGPDSVALLHLLQDRRLGLELELAHVHHAAREIEADRDAAFCEDLGDRLDLPFHLLRIETEPTPADGREASWRRHRYSALLDLASQRHACAVATAHHRDDVSEGVLLQLLRGTGLRALAGIQAETDRGVIRPLLPWRREDILRWLHRHDIEWCHDSSNRDTSHLRNRVRHIILPDLRIASPRIDDHLVHLAAAIADDEEYFSVTLQHQAPWIDPWCPDGGVPIRTLNAMPPSLRSRWLHAQAARAGIGPVTRRQIELFDGLVEASRPRSVTLAGRWRLRRARSRLWLEPPSDPAGYEEPLRPDGCVALTIPGWVVRTTRHASPSQDARWSFTVPAAAPLQLRTAKPGDAVIADGSEISVPRLIARRVPRHLRAAWPVLCESARITWIPGVWQGPEDGDLLVEVFTHG